MALLALLAAGTAYAQPAPGVPIVLDGEADDWRTAPLIIDDPADAPGPYADVRRVHARHDADAVYLAVEVERPVALQGMPGTLVLLLDADGNRATGWERHGVRGVDAAIEFSRRKRRESPREGIWLRTMDSAGRPHRVREANVAGVMTAPSHAARWFEVRIPRNGPVRFGPGMAVRLVSLNAEGGEADRTPVAPVDLRDPLPRPTPPGAGAADPLARAPGTDFRVVSWNVGREALFERPDAFGAILRPLAPDLLMLDEVAGGHSLHEVEDRLNHALPGDRPWRAIYGTSGESQRGVIAMRGTAPAVVRAFAGRLPYPDSARTLEPAGSVPVTGAVVQIGGRRLLAVTVDLEAAGRPGSRSDRLRRMEALVIRDALAAAVRAGGMDGVLVTGDLNLVGSRDPLDILSAAGDVDGSALSVPLPLRLDGVSAATWEDNGTSFTPGRLDFVLLGDAALAVTGGFVFRAADLSPEWRARHGVGANASGVTDHLPIVTDLRWVDRPR